MKKIWNLFILATMSFPFFSCATTANKSVEEVFQSEGFEQKISLNTSQNSSTPAEKMPEKFIKPGIKCEIEDMKLTNCETVYDESASKKKSVKFFSNSYATVDIEIPEGEYEILFSQKAFSTSASHIKVSVAENNYTTYPSEPPLGIWELTIRKPIIFINEEPRTVTIKVQSEEPFDTSAKSFYLDYFQILKK